MKVIEIKNRKSKFDIAIVKFRKSRRFEDFVDLLEYCLIHKSYESQVLLEEWNSGKEAIPQGDHLSAFTAFLPKFSVRYLDPSHISDIIPGNDEQGASLVGLIDEFRDIQQRIDGYMNEYSWFHQSIAMSVLLKEVYPDNFNPGMVIAKNLKLIFPENIPSDVAALSEDYPFSPEYVLPYDSIIHRLVKQVGEWILEKTVMDRELKETIDTCFHDYLDPENRACQSIKQGEPLRFFANLLRCPRDLYYSWLNECLLNHDSPWLSSQEQLKAALKCLPIGIGNKPLIFVPSYYNSLDSELRKQFNKLYSDIPNIETSKFISFPNFFDLVYRAMDFLFEVDHECSDLFKDIVANLTKHRQEYHSGCTTFAGDRYYSEAEFLIDAIGLDSIDLSLLLSTGSSFFGNFFLFPDEDDYTYFDHSDFLNERQKTYLAAFDKSVSEGFSDLGVSLLSLYIISRAMNMKGRFGQLPELLPSLRQSLALSGAPIIKHTLATVVEVVEKYFSDDPIAMCSARIFKQLLPQVAELHVLGGGQGRQNNKSEVQSFLQGELGKERWDKLSADSQDCLLSAELQWKNSAIEFGFGIKDWSGLIVTYCKVVEGELVERLNGFFVSDEYAAYLQERKITRLDKPTAGCLLKVLKDFDKMPQYLQEMVSNSRIKLVSNPKLVSRLYDLVLNYRNTSAHSGAVGMKRFAGFKEELFQKRLLHDFIDTLE